jgi:hypothetical protein
MPHVGELLVEESHEQPAVREKRLPGLERRGGRVVPIET